MATYAERDLTSTSEQLPDIVRGRYEVVRRLPGGVHGPSWQVRDAGSGAPLVLRHLAAGAGAELLFAGNLRRLSVAAARCVGAAPVQEVLEDGSAVWLAREYVQGENLGEALSVLGTLTPAQGRAIIGAACRGLLVEERDLLVHGNLRPENVLIDPDGRVLISDHGLRIVGTRMVVAQPLTYLAPELAAGEPPSPAADVYALGALLYAAVCGRYPLALTGDPTADRAVLAAHQIIQPPARVDLSGGLGHAIWKALQPRPTDRFPTALDMLIALGRPGALELSRSSGGRVRRIFR